ncbi:ROK family protein [Rhodovastum atsumiense]|uniref:ROK family protein n=2 Tax=Rhodovastum atsumiense TaxID=504468 RepID=A0A5M6ITJ2_9PROT|nr:ROK family protein [Rhodovastum atsumiense]
MGEASKADLARQAGLTQNTAGQIVRKLAQQQLVCTVGKRTGARGQPATMLRLAPEGAYAIGIKLGRRSLDALLIDFSGRILQSRRHEHALPPPETALRLVHEEITGLRAAIPPRARGRLVGAGLAMPYNIGSWRRELDLSEDLCLAWNGFDLAGQLQRMLDVPVMVENDGTAVGIAELFTGVGRELDDFLCVFIGTAIGGGLVLGGEYRRGAAGNAADIGLVPVPPSRLHSAPKPTGASDILLTRASVSSLIRHLVHSGLRIGSRAELEQALAIRPPPVEDWLADCADALVQPLLATACMLDLQAIVIGGDLPDDLVAELIGRLRHLLVQAVPEAREPPVLVPGTVGRNAAALGAAILPLHLSYSPARQILFGN